MKLGCLWNYPKSKSTTKTGKDQILKKKTGATKKEKRQKTGNVKSVPKKLANHEYRKKMNKNWLPKKATTPGYTWSVVGATKKKHNKFAKKSPIFQSAQVLNHLKIEKIHFKKTSVFFVLKNC